MSSTQASAAATQQKTVLVSGQDSQSVTVQSQLATSTVAGSVTSNSNLNQVVTDLSAAHTAHSAWVEKETKAISDWGQGEIQRLLAGTKSTEEALIKGASEKQTAIDLEHKAELSRLVQQMDLKRAAQLKELEDGLQRQIQAILTSSKQQINAIETQMNEKKMDLLKRSQEQQGRDIDQLSNLVVQTKLVPSVSKTVIETTTNTGNVVAVATGGRIETGSAESTVIESTKIAAVPNAGELKQEAQVTTGDMVRDRDSKKVGEGVIVSTQTKVVEQRDGAAAAGSKHVDASYGNHHTKSSLTGAQTEPKSTDATKRVQ